LKAELTIPPEIIRAIAEEVASILKPMMKRLDTPKQMDGLMGMDELAKYLGGVSKDWIYQRTAKNEIPFVKIGHLTKFSRSDIDRWLSAQVVPVVSSLSRRLPVAGPVATPPQDIQSRGGGEKKCS
jgi:excisionase family DNA binding protein